MNRPRDMHTLLRRQLKRHVGGVHIPTELGELLHAVDQAYHEFDDDRLMLERSLELSSRELLQANSEMRAIFRALPDLFFLLDADGQILDCKGGCAEDFFLPPEDLLGKRIQDVPTASVARAFDAALRAIQSEGGPATFNYELRIEGETTHHEARLLPLHDGQILAIVRNMTEQKRSAEELVAQRAFLRQIIDLNPSFIFAKDREGRFTLANQAVATAFGASVETLTGRIDGEFIKNTSELERIRRDDLEVIESRQEKLIPEESITDAHGELRWMQTIKRPIHGRDGRVDLVLGVSTDITKRKLAEESLTERTEQVRRNGIALHEIALLRSRSLGEALGRITEIAARTLDVDRIAVWMHLDDRSALGCRHIHDRGRTLPRPESPVSRSAFPRYFTALAEERSVAVADVRADSRVRSGTGASLHRAPIAAALDVSIRIHGTGVGVMSYQHAGSPRSWSPEERNFAASVADLVSVAIQTDRRRLLEEQLRQSQKMEAVGLLAGGIAHDFNNLLNVILGYCDLARSRVPESHGVTEHLDKVATAANRAADLTRKLLTVSRKHVVKLETVDLGEVLDDFDSLLGRIVGEDVEVLVTREQRPLNVRADRAQLDQVLLNLCTNARQAMPYGGRLSIETSCVALEPDALPAGGRPGEFVRLRVGDTGTGMSEDVKARLWEPFFSTKAEGTGLGLAMVYGIVEQHDGFVTVESEPGQGCRIDVWLPLQPDAPSPQAPREDRSLPLGHETVLVAEDEALLRDLIVSCLSELGYKVLAASDGREAVDLFAEHADRIDVAIMDVVMPKLSGPDAYRRMRDTRPGTKVLFVTGYAPDTSRLSEVLDDEHVDVLVKPFRMEELAWRLRQIIESRIRS